MKIKTMLTMLLMAAVMAPAEGGAQMPGVGSLPSSIIPDKAALLEQAKKILADLMAMKQDPKLPAADKAKVDTLIPKAQSANTELAKPEVEPSKLTQLASQLGDLQKQVAAIKPTAVR
jgi:hypothetical protein